MSNINPYNINGAYPVAGQDNDSQGFRDNFTNIRNNLSYAASEISDLQNKTLVTSALTGGTLTNNMGYNQIRYAQLFSPSYTYLDNGTWTSASAFVLDYSLGSVQQITTGGALSLSFNSTTWPASGQHGALKLILSVTNVAHTLTVPVATVGLSNIAGANASTGIIVFDQVGTYTIEFTTSDGGTTVTINDQSRNYASLRDPNLYFNNSVASTLFVGFGSAISTAIASDSLRNTVMADGSYSAVTVGNLSMGNLLTGTIDTGDLSGFNITSARGNLTTGNIYPVSSNDQLGYFNAVTFTGNGLGGTTTQGNAFTQVSRIGFYATGSNLSYGLGGNIAFFTAKSANGINQNAVSQAVGIENDQSLNLYGNLFLSSTGTSSSYYPATATSVGTPGQIAWRNASGTVYMYVCFAPNQWGRVTMTTTGW